MLHDEVIPAKEGVSSINGFFDYFFPRKAMWSSKASTRETVASLKKFYKCLAEIGLMEEFDYRFLLSEVKQNKEDWLEHYDNQSNW
ncbi:MAG: hypothetical protein ABW166_16040 [Sedimenticola sp.]